MKKIMKIFGSWEFSIVLILLFILHFTLVFNWISVLMFFEKPNEPKEYYISNNKITIPNNMNLYKIDLIPYSDEVDAIFIRYKLDIIAVGKLKDLDEKTMSSYFDYLRSYLNDQNDLENQFMYHFVINYIEGWGFRCLNGSDIEENLIFPDQHLYFSFLSFDMEFENVIDYLGDLYFTDADSLEWSMTPF